MSGDIVKKLRDKQLHSAEAFGCEEYLPMKAFWASYASLSEEAADLITTLTAERDAALAARQHWFDAYTGATKARFKTQARADAASTALLQVEALTRALEPFAAALELIDHGPDNMPAGSWIVGESQSHLLPRVKHFRAAREALRSLSKEGETNG